MTKNPGEQPPNAYARGNNQFQILTSIAVHNKRPSTKPIAKKWPRELVNLVKTLWATKPDDRPTISEAKAVLVEQIGAKAAELDIRDK